MNKTQKEMDNVAVLAEKTFNSFVLCGKKDDENIITVKGKPYELLFFMNKLYRSIKESFEDVFESKIIAESLMRAISFSDEDLEKLVKEIMSDDNDEDDGDDETVPNSDIESDKEELRKAIEGLIEALENLDD